MAAELNMYQAQTTEYKIEIERLTTELDQTKTKYYESKRRESLSRDMVRQRRSIAVKSKLNNSLTLNASLPDIAPPVMPRTTRHSR